ncbi:hypothetical protein [Saccharopolyspora sp. NPDC050642]|uniref:hypothetical protein n=1 Tax=Saccharopolyspora sp. NPDC050642 TaxID=3157099 RepID=UPI0033F54A5C
MHQNLGTRLREYDFFSLDSYFEGCGDWVFTAALHGVRGWRAAEFREAMTGRIDADRLELCLRLHDLVPDWISAYAKEIADTAGGLIGFTTTFQQNTASLALARELKRLDPASRIVFGGANCDGPQGAAWHRNFEFVDFVVRGEGELALPALVEHLDRGGDPARIPGLCPGFRRLPGAVRRMRRRGRDRTQARGGGRRAAAGGARTARSNVPRGGECGGLAVRGDCRCRSVLFGVDEHGVAGVPVRAGPESWAGVGVAVALWRAAVRVQLGVGVHQGQG